MKKNLFLFSWIFTLGAMLTSCLNDKEYALDPSNGHNVIEFYNVTSPGTAYTAKYLTYTPKTFVAEPESEFTIGVNYAGPEDGALTISPSPLHPIPQ